MENKLKRLFDYQRFANNERLAGIIEETESRRSAELRDEDLFTVNAAGSAETLKRPDNDKNHKSADF